MNGSQMTLNAKLNEYPSRVQLSALKLIGNSDKVDCN